MTQHDPHNPPPTLTGRTTAGGQIVLSPKLDMFRRLYRWLNLTLVHQGLWPLLLLLTSAPAGTPGETPMPWYLARLAGPTLAATAALAYLRQPPRGDRRPAPFAAPAPGALATQVRFIAIGVAILLAAARILAGPTEPALRLVLFGLIDVIAFQAIHFGLVRRTFADRDEGIGMATILFALSWGLRDLLLTALGPTAASPPLAFVTGILVGAAIAWLSRLLYRWPGGMLAAGAVHWLLIYLIVGFA